MTSRRRYAAGVAVLVVSTLYGCAAWFGVLDAYASGDALRGPWTYERGRYQLLRPEAQDASIGPRIRNPSLRRAVWFALAYHYDATVYARPAANASRLGIVRRGTQLRAVGHANGRGCRHGWYQLASGGYVCHQEGFLVSRKQQSFWLRQPKADLNRPLFYRYARVTTPGALRFVRIPTEAEEAELGRYLADRNVEEGGTILPEFVQARLEGDYFVALDRVESAGERKFYRTVRGRYLRMEDVEPRPAPRMQGEWLVGRRQLPWAFIYGEGEATLLRNRGGRLREVGSAEPHGRFPLEGLAEHEGKTYALGPDQFAVARERVRIARRIARPRGISAKEKWIHVDLTEQTLVAYEGDRPVFVTLVSSGKEETGHQTPTGLYRITDKYASVTMSGRDPIEGHYEVADVPWTQFYHGSYALHGAYWHDTFGSTRSHGCTNLAPPDARWLFFWTTPELPRGFHARSNAGKGTAVYLNRTRRASGRATRTTIK